MFEYALMIIASISLMIVLIIAITIIVDRLRHKHTNESLRKWLISSAIIFIGSAFVAKAINDQQSKNTTTSKTLTMKVINDHGSNVPKQDGHYQIDGKKNQNTTFTIKTNRDANINYNVKNNNAKVHIEQLSKQQYKLVVDSNEQKAVTVYINAAVIGQRIGNDVLITNQ